MKHKHKHNWNTTCIIVVFFLLSSMYTVQTYSQDKKKKELSTIEALKLQIVEVKENIRKLKETKEQEEEYHKQFTEEKEGLIKQMKEQVGSVNKEINDIKQSIATYSNQIQNTQLFVERDNCSPSTVQKNIPQLLRCAQTNNKCRHPF